MESESPRELFERNLERASILVAKINAKGTCHCRCGEIAQLQCQLKTLHARYLQCGRALWVAGMYGGILTVALLWCLCGGGR